VWSGKTLLTFQTSQKTPSQNISMINTNKFQRKEERLIPVNGIESSEKAISPNPMENGNSHKSKMNEVTYNSFLFL
jgi:hypothetical protein